ncbi:MAG TPA: PAS domain S-box protein, partial [Verrucomicrobiae bacterium]|nr:PAS domain S-box protein [Verrucomicrobiae bacterium]
MTKTLKLFFVFCLALAGLRVFSQDVTNTPALTRIGQVRALSAAEITESPRVQIEATVTLAIPRRSYFWIQDERDGIRLYVRRKNLTVQPGDRVLVTGKVVPGETGPMIAPDEVKVLSDGKPPEPVLLSAAELNTFADLDRRVQVDGHVLRVIQKSSRWQIELESGTDNFWVELTRQTNSPAPALLDATIRARGICVRQLFEWGEKIRPTLLIQNPADISILHPGNPKALADREHIPVTTIASLTHESISKEPAEVHLRGTVLDQRLGEHIVVRDSSGAVEAKSTEMVIVPAQREVDVWGTPSWNGGHLSLRNATFRIVDTNSVPNASKTRNRAEKKPATLPLLTKASQLLNLSPEEAAWKYPIHFRGVVTLYCPERRQFFVQDDTGGFYVAGPWNRTDLKTGDLVDIRGVSNPGGFAPVVLPREVTPSGTAAFPKPRRATLFQLATGQYDSQWVEIRGVIRAVSEEDNLTRLKISDTDGTVFVDIPSENAPTNLLDSVVRLRGICAAHATSTRQISSLVIWCPSLDFVNVEDWGTTNPLDLPVQSITSLNRFRPYNQLQRRVNIKGVVTACQNDKSFFVQDDAAGIEIETSSPSPKIQAGDQVLVTGYPTPGTFGVVLREAVFQTVSPGKMPEPKAINSEDPLNPEFQNMLVQADARLKFRTRKTLTLQMPGQIVEVTSPRTLSQTDGLEIGSLLRVTGIYRVITDEARLPVAFQIFVPGGAPVQVLEKPSWWTFRHTLYVIALLLALMTGTVFWGMMLRRKVREKTTGLRESESKFRSLVEKSLVGVYIIQNEKFVYVNPRLAEMLGYTTDEMLSLKVDDVVFSEDRELVRDQFRRRLSGEVATVRYHFRVTRKDSLRLDLEVLGNITEFNGAQAILGTAMDITERKRAEEELFESRQMLRTVLDTIPQRVFWKNRDLRFAGCNKSFAQDHGLSDPSEMSGKSAFDINTSEAAAMFQEEDRKIMESGGSRLNLDRLLTKPDGTQRWLRVSKAPLFDKEGNVHGVLGTYEDITEHKQAQIQLDQASSLLETLLANSPDYIYFKDRESRFVRASNSLAHRFHVSSTKDLIGKTDFDFFNPEHAQSAFD